MTTPTGLGWFLIALLTSYGMAIGSMSLAFWPGRAAGRGLGLACVPLVMLCVLLVPANLVGLRAALAFACGELAFKLVDIHRQEARTGCHPGGRACLSFLAPFPVLAILFPDHRKRLDRPDPWMPLVGVLLLGVVGFGLAILAVRFGLATRSIRSHWVLAHGLRLVAFVVAIESLSRGIWALERLAGFDTRPLIRNAYRARTVSDFWRRYNDRVHDWFFRHVFEPTGGRRRPIRSILLVFLASGLFHEWMFDLATSSVTGFQLAFFTLQGPALLATDWLDRATRPANAAGRIVTRMATIGFFALTAFLFLDGVERVFPFVRIGPEPGIG